MLAIQEEFDRVFRINTRGQFFVAREAYKHLPAGGRIILMSSNTTRDKIVPNHSVYAGSKGAIESFVRCLALDCGRKRITVNAVAPGATVTDMFHETVRLYVPGGKDMSDEQIEQVSGILTYPAGNVSLLTVSSDRLYERHYTWTRGHWSGCSSRSMLPRK